MDFGGPQNEHFSVSYCNSIKLVNSAVAQREMIFLTWAQKIIFLCQKTFDSCHIAKNFIQPFPRKFDFNAIVERSENRQNCLIPAVALM